MPTPSKAARRAAKRANLARKTAVQVAHERGWKVIKDADGRVTVRR